MFPIAAFIFWLMWLLRASDWSRNLPKYLTTLLIWMRSLTTISDFFLIFSNCSYNQIECNLFCLYLTSVLFGPSMSWYYWKYALVPAVWTFLVCPILCRSSWLNGCWEIYWLLCVMVLLSQLMHCNRLRCLLCCMIPEGHWSWVPLGWNMSCLHTPWSILVLDFCPAILMWYQWVQNVVPLFSVVHHGP